MNIRFAIAIGLGASLASACAADVGHDGIGSTTQSVRDQTPTGWWNDCNDPRVTCHSDGSREFTGDPVSGVEPAPLVGSGSGGGTVSNRGTCALEWVRGYIGPGSRVGVIASGGWRPVIFQTADDLVIEPIQFAWRCEKFSLFGLDGFDARRQPRSVEVVPGGTTDGDNASWTHPFVRHSGPSSVQLASRSKHPASGVQLSLQMPDEQTTSAPSRGSGHSAGPSTQRGEQTQLKAPETLPNSGQRSRLPMRSSSSHSHDGHGPRTGPSSGSAVRLLWLQAARAGATTGRTKCFKSGPQQSGRLSRLFGSRPSATERRYFPVGPRTTSTTGPWAEGTRYRR
jgi:hypothetical protein